MVTGGEAAAITAAPLRIFHEPGDVADIPDGVGEPAERLTRRVTEVRPEVALPPPSGDQPARGFVIGNGRRLAIRVRHEAAVAVTPPARTAGNRGPTPERTGSGAPGCAERATAPSVFPSGRRGGD